MGFSLFGAIDKEVEEGARNIMSQDFEISNNDEHSASADKVSIVIIILSYVKCQEEFLSSSCVQFNCLTKSSSSLCLVVT